MRAHVLQHVDFEGPGMIATPDLVDGLMTHCRHELAPRRWVQDEAHLRAAGADRYIALGRLLDDVLSYLHAARPRAEVA